MILRIIIVIAICIASFAVRGLDWEVTPTQCIVNSTDELCQSDVLINISKMGKSAVCLYADKNLVECFENQHAVTTRIPLQISAKVILELINEEGIVVKSLVIEYTLIKPKRRRVRLPWSVF